MNWGAKGKTQNSRGRLLVILKSERRHSSSYGLHDDGEKIGQAEDLWRPEASIDCS